MLSNLNYIQWKSVTGLIKTEAVSGLADFQHPYFLKKGWERSRSVGLVPGFGTVFLIAPDILMTNWHVFRRSDWPLGLNVAFDVELGDDGLPMVPVRHALRPDVLFYSYDKLDFCVVAVDGNPGDTRGYVNLRNFASVKSDSRANIIQHPAGGLKQIAVRENSIKHFDDDVIQYWTDTEHGSSGSPVFDDNWEILGLHFQHDSAPDSFGKEIFFNEAHSIKSIVAHIDTIAALKGKI